MLLLRRERKQRLQSLEAEAKVTLQELTPQDVFARRLALEEREGEDWSDEEQQAIKARVTQAFNDVLNTLKEEAE